MTHIELQAGYANYDFKDCKQARKSARFLKRKAHKAMRRVKVNHND